MSPPRHISYSPLLPTTGSQVHTSSKHSEAYHYYRSPCPHLTIYLILYYYLPQVYRSTRRQNPQKHIITTGHHVPTSPYISFSTTTYYRSTGQHVVKTLRSIPIPQVTMSPPRHISYSLLLPTTGLQVNTSSKPSEAYHYYRSICPHLAIYLILYYYLLQVNTSSKPPKSYHYYRSPCPHLTISYSLLLPTTGLQVNMSSKPSESIHYYRSPCHHLAISHPLLLPTTGQHVVKALRIILYYRSTCPHLAIYLILYYYLLQVNTSSKPSEAYQYHRSSCHHLAIYLILHYYLLHVNTLSKPPEAHQYYRSTVSQTQHPYLP